MPEILLSPQDPRLGAYNAEGGIEKWPETDVHGAPYERILATVRRLSASAFVVLGVGRDSPELVIRIGAAPAARTGKAEDKG